MAFVDTVPDSKSLQATYSSQEGLFLGIAQQKYIPKNLDGTVFDCTGYDHTINLHIIQSALNGVDDSPAPANLDVLGTAAVAFDATGAQINFTSSQVSTGLLTQHLAAGSYNYALEGQTTGGNKALLSQGTINVIGRA